jgi:hypothetical protein
VEKKAAVTVPHHPRAEAHETDRTIAEIMSFPARSRDVFRTEENSGDFPIARTGLPSIQRPQSEDVAVTACPRQLRRAGTGLAAGQTTPETNRGGGADLEQLIEGQKDRWGIGVALAGVNTEDAPKKRDDMFAAIAGEA